jgi:RNA polymerase sigma-70 factor (ECF subfamily)
VVQLISDTYVNDPADADARLGALRTCLNKLDPQQKQLVRDRYVARMSVKSLAARIGSTANQISARLYRIRKTLAKCVESVLARELRS